MGAAESMRAPVIIGTAEVLFPYGPLEEVSYYLIPMAKKADVPVVVHLDHGLTKETCLKALELGFSSIMYDCSTDSYEENIRKVKEITKLAHLFGATVEAELGHVGDNEGVSALERPEDYFRLLPEELPREAMDSKTLSRLLHLRQALGTAASLTLRRAGVLKSAGKRGRCNLYRFAVPESDKENKEVQPCVL